MGVAHLTSKKGGGPGGHGVPKLAPGRGQWLHKHLHLLLPGPMEVVLHHHLCTPPHHSVHPMTCMRGTSWGHKLGAQDGGACCGGMLGAHLGGICQGHTSRTHIGGTSWKQRCGGVTSCSRWLERLHSSRFQQQHQAT